MMNSKTFFLSVVLLLLIVGCKTPPQQGHQGGCQQLKVLAFTASWCAPCQRAKSALIQIQATGVDVEIIDIDEQPDLAKQYGVTSVPTFFVYVCGKKVVQTHDIAVVVTLTHARCN